MARPSRRGRLRDRYRQQRDHHRQVVDAAGHAIVGLSMPRDGTFGGLALDSEFKKRDADPWCGVQIANLASGDIVEWIRLEGDVSKLFDVAAISGVRWPIASGFLNDEVHRLYTYET
jgi:Domain of unknown function (DUF4915)